MDTKVQESTWSWTVLRLPLQDARNWWYHRQLRERGEVDAARRLERKTVCRYLSDLQSAIVLHVTSGGWTLFRESGRLEGHGGRGSLFVQATLAAGVPLVDTSVEGKGVRGHE